MPGTRLSELGSRLWPAEADDLSPVAAAARDVLREHFEDRPPDPLERLMDPSFQEQTWEHEGSSADLEIPGMLHHQQREALEARARHKWLFWANQSGKTTYGAVNCALWALGRHPDQRWEPPVIIWASALSWDLWETILLPELLTWIPKHRIIQAPPPNQHSTIRQIFIRADNGRISRIVGKSAEQGRQLYQSARVHVFWSDEEHPESIWDEVQPRLVRFGGLTMATMTPLLGMTWVYHRVYEPWLVGSGEDNWCSHAGLADNPSIEPEEIERVRREFAGDPAQLAARLEGRFTRPAGLAIEFDPSQEPPRMERRRGYARARGPGLDAVLRDRLRALEVRIRPPRGRPRGP